MHLAVCFINYCDCKYARYYGLKIMVFPVRVFFETIGNFVRPCKHTRTFYLDWGLEESLVNWLSIT